MKRFSIKIEGIVQGVGFRPFVYNMAINLKLKGWVNNNSQGVHIDIEGEEAALDDFLIELKKNPPSLCKIENITIEEKSVIGFSEFEIKNSELYQESITLISPDISICDQCVQDITDKKNRRYKYPFTNCTNCGPRFSIIKALPYDREKTTMENFKMCPQCEKEYMDSSNRRFHAQPTGCSCCGPKLWIENTYGDILDIKDIIQWTQKKLKEGKIFAIKGLGGFHFVCDAKNHNAIATLREKKRRPHKPLAVMVRDIVTAKKFCKINEVEQEILEGINKPIVVLDRIKEYALPDSIAPGQKTLGVMLPYTPLHLLLFDDDLDVLIMTSANGNGSPIEFDNYSARKSLSNVVDYFLMHDREIFVPVDDSVLRVVNDKVSMIRRARGYVPLPMKTENIEEILACGANMKNTFCLAKEDFIFMSQFNGDLENLQTFEHYERNIEHFKRIFTMEPKFIAHDLHPTYLSTEYALRYPIQRIAVQHHHAHIVSCMMENHLKSKVIGICFDGTGYGLDGNIWGGEFFICDRKEFERVAHLDYIKLPGGEKAIREPWRIATAYIHKAFSKQIEFDGKSSCSEERLKEICHQLLGKKSLDLLKFLNSNFNFPLTSSVGRLFDAVSALIGIRDIVSYEGQASMELEACAEVGEDGYYSYHITKDGCYIIKPYSIICEIVDDIFHGISKGVIASKFHNTVANFIADVCNRLREDNGLNEVAISGGVFQNVYLLEMVISKLTMLDFKIYIQSEFPANDGGVSLGQLIIANEIIKS